MSEIVLRPSKKFIFVDLAVVAVVILFAVVVHVAVIGPAGQPPWLPLVSLLLLIVPLNRWLKQTMIKVTIVGDKLRFETGLLTKSTRIIQLSKIQDVRVNQTLIQRLFNVGDVAIETAGESSRLVLPHYDQPNHIAEEILTASGVR